MNQITSVKDEHSVIHSTFTIERTYPQSPERVFFAFADKATVRQWRIEGDGFAISEFSFDFRVGGSEVSRFSYAGGPE
ncbi:MAG: polyketide cyclase, partial [Mesorhizobium sp.]